MPNPRILKVLNMTPQQWGALPPDVPGMPGYSDERTKLKAKAMELIAEEDAKAGGSLGDRVLSLEYRVSALEGHGGESGKGKK